MKSGLIRPAVLVVLILSTLLMSGCGEKETPIPQKDYSISGKVLWGGTTVAVENATVKVGAVSATTNAEGVFQLTVTAPEAGLAGTLEVTHELGVASSIGINTASDLVVSDIFLSRLIHVAPDGDNVTGDGTAAKPFKTITKALSVNGWVTVQIAAGTYQTGESFPLTLRENDVLIGAGSTQTIIVSSSIALWIANSGVRIVSLGLEQQDLAKSATGILTQTTNPVAFSIEQCSIKGWSHAVQVNTDGSLDITDSEISGNNTALYVTGTALYARRCKITGNATGVFLFADADVNLGDTASPGQNDFRSNTTVGVGDSRPTDSGAIYAIGNTWNAAAMPATATSATEGGTDFDIVWGGNSIIFSE